MRTILILEHSQPRDCLEELREYHELVMTAQVVIVGDFALLNIVGFVAVVLRCGCQVFISNDNTSFQLPSTHL